MSVGHDMENVRRRHSAGEELGEKGVRKRSIKDEARANEGRERRYEEGEGMIGEKKKYSVRQEMDGGDFKRHEVEDGMEGMSPLTSLPPLSALLNDEDVTQSYSQRTSPSITPSTIYTHSLSTRPPLTLEIPTNPTPGPKHDLATNLAFYQAATHATNLCRNELEQRRIYMQRE
jgi:hypothetical protein